MPFTTELHQAVKQGDTEKISRLLAEGVDANATDVYGQTALYLAVKFDRLDLVKLLFPRSDANKPDITGCTPLCRAILEKKFEIAQFLLEYGADPLTVDSDGRTSVHLAAMQGNLPLLQRLSDAAPSALVRADTEGMTPLHWAVVHHLSPTMIGDSSVRSDNIAVIEWLLSVAHVDPNIPDKEGSTALYTAITFGLTQIVELLLTHGADANQLSFGSLPLHEVAKKDLLKIAKILANKTKCIDYRNGKGITPLDLALSKHSITMVECLLNAGANPNAVASPDEILRYGILLPPALWQVLYFYLPHEVKTPESRTYEMVKLLLLFSADPTGTDGKKNTPLHLVAEGGRADIAELLLEAGAEMDAKNNVGITPLESALHKRSQHLRTFIDETGAARSDVAQYIRELVNLENVIACFLRHGESIGRDFTRPRFTRLVTLCPTMLENAVVIGAKFPVDYRPPASAITTPAKFFARVWTAQQYLTFMCMTEKACRADPANMALVEFHRALLMKMQTHSLKLAASMVVGNKPTVRTLVADDMNYLYSTGKMREGVLCPKELYPLFFAHPKMRAEVKRVKAARARVVEMEVEAAGAAAGAASAAPGL